MDARDVEYEQLKQRIDMLEDRVQELEARLMPKHSHQRASGTFNGNDHRSRLSAPMMFFILVVGVLFIVGILQYFNGQ